jgi:valyl-tRNA synthetase
VVKALNSQGLLDGIDDYTLNVGICDRCKTVVEPLVSMQWFVKTKPLAEKALQAVATKAIEIVPENWTKTYDEWMTNIRDWCVSRQLWWGHRIPAWYCGKCDETIVAREDPTACPVCGSKDLKQDPDVLDTWFSSGLWPFSTLGWPEHTVDLREFYPTSLLITGFDILFFWVARMIMLGIEFMGDVPFRQVYIHGLVRDADKQKMSKTKGNVIDPLVVTEKYGTDAVRMALLSGAAPGTDIVFSPDRLESAQAFANKIWNAARFLFFHMERCGVEPWTPDDPGRYVVEGSALEDRWIFSRFNACAAQVNRAIGMHRFHDAAQAVWHFLWGDFCDWYVELKKLRFRENSGLNADWRNALAVFESALRLLHPVMPFLTEELWQRLGNATAERPVSIALAAFPVFRAELEDAAAEREMALVRDVIAAARNLRSELKLDPKLAVAAKVFGRPEVLDVIRAQSAAIEKLAIVTLEMSEGAAPRGVGAVSSTAQFDLVFSIPAELAGALRAAQEKEREQLAKVIANSERQLNDEKFMSKAPTKVIDTLRSKLADYEAQLKKIDDALHVAS